MVDEILKDLKLRHEMLKTIASVMPKLDEFEDAVDYDYDGRLVTIYATETEGADEKPILQVRLKHSKDGVDDLQLMFEGDGGRKMIVFNEDETLEDRFEISAEFIEGYTEGWLEEFEDGRLRWDWLGD